MHYNYHRYYDSTTGRFLTSDPIGLAGGINPFVYSENNPINHIDPKGLSSFILFGRGPYFNLPRVLRNFPRNFRPKKPPKESACEPKYEPRRAPTAEELELPPDDFFWQQDPGRGFLKPKPPRYNPNNPPRTKVPPIENEDAAPRRGPFDWDPQDIPYA